MVGRQGLGLALGLGGALAVAAWLGPEAYGRWAIVYGPALWLQGFVLWGAPVWALAHDDRAAFGFTAAAAAGLGFAAALLAVVSPLAGGALAAAALGVLAAVPAARLERQGRWRALALVELAGQAAQVAVAVGLAARGWGVVAPLLGAWAGGLVLIAALLCARAVPSPRLGAAREILAHGATLTAAMQLWTARDLVPALVIAPLAGPEAVAALAIGRRVVDAAAFAKGALWRVAVARLTRARHDAEALRAGLADEQRAQRLVAAPLIAVSLAAPAIGLLGPGWAAAAPLVPIVALAVAVNAAFVPGCAALVALGRHRELAAFHAMHLLLLAGVAAWAAPRWGPLAWGFGEIAAFAAYPLVTRRPQVAR